MTQYSGSMNDPFAASPAEPPRTSGLAVGSLVCSLIFCCPITTLLAPFLGLAAIVSIGNNPMRRGKGLALAGILLGIIFTAIWAVALVWIGGYAKEAFAMVEGGPREALTAGFNGDIAGFKAQFHGDGATAPDDQARAFLDELRKRYGGFVSSQMSESGRTNPQPGNPVVPFPYILTFDNGNVDATVEIVFADQQTGGFINKLGSIVVHDPQRGDLTYPSPVSTGASPPTVPSGSASP